MRWGSSYSIVEKGKTRKTQSKDRTERRENIEEFGGQPAVSVFLLLAYLNTKLKEGLEARRGAASMVSRRREWKRSNLPAKQCAKESTTTSRGEKR